MVKFIFNVLLLFWWAVGWAYSVHNNNAGWASFFAVLTLTMAFVVVWTYQDEFE